jgi:7-cyano-7-deazaguanine tRNA-ribosyltransferase
VQGNDDGQRRRRWEIRTRERVRVEWELKRMVSFEMEARDGLARLGRLRMPHGEASTPALLPVIHPGQMIIPPARMKKLFGAQIVITNSYIIRGREEFREKALKEGVGRLIGWDGPVMTDSGTFQSYMYGEVEVSQPQILEFQKDIGSDLCTMLDIFSTPETSEKKAAEQLQENNRRAREASALFYGKKVQGAGSRGQGDDERLTLSSPGTPHPAPGTLSSSPGTRNPVPCTQNELQGLVLAVQGGLFPALREESAKVAAGLECAVQAIGGVVPLMENYRFADLVEVVMAAKRGLNPSRPVHLFGAGHPMMFALASLMGCDLFDSSSYAKYAKDGRMMFRTGTRSLEELEHFPCSCPVCSEMSPAETRKLPEEERTRRLAEHNLHVSFAELRTVRQAIVEGSLWELVEERCRAHPSLLTALFRLGRHAGFLERYASITRRGAFFYKGPESSFRPEVVRWMDRIESRYRMPSAEITVCLPEGPKPYSRYYHELVARVQDRWDARFVVASFFGPVPLELDGMYPVAQSLVPEQLDPASVQRIGDAMKRFSHRLRTPISIVWDGPGSMDALEMLASPRKDLPQDPEMLRVSATADMQFGAGAAGALLAGKVELVRSPNTGRVRNVLSDGEHLLSLRAGDGQFSLRVPGAERLRRAFPSPALRVMVDADAAEFAAQGKNVFAKFVKDCDPGLRPNDEVMVVDEKDTLAAVGRALMVRDEMLAFGRGMAVRVRQGVRRSHGEREESME